MRLIKQIGEWLDARLRSADPFARRWSTPCHGKRRAGFTFSEARRWSFSGYKW